MRKLAANSLLTTEDQKRLYEEVMGKDALARQTTAADAEAGRCICTPVKVKRRWEDSPDRPLARTVHDAHCAKWKPWMYEVRPR